MTGEHHTLWRPLQTKVVSTNSSCYWTDWRGDCTGREGSSPQDLQHQQETAPMSNRHEEAQGILLGMWCWVTAIESSEWTCLFHSPLQDTFHLLTKWYTHCKANSCFTWKQLTSCIPALWKSVSQVMTSASTHIQSLLQLSSQELSKLREWK